MRMPLLVLPILAGCSQPATTDAPQPRAGASGTVAGLYERVAPGDVVDRICLTADEPGRFGLVTAGEGAANCTAKGEFTAQGTKLSLRIDGAPACELSATTTAAGLTLDKAEGRECAYYCGASARLVPGAFTRVGTSAADIGKVVDFAGDPLC